MGLLEQLWDDTVAGPRPESGLGKLRKHSTSSGRPSSGSKELDGGSARSYGEDSSESPVRITRSIMIVRPPGYQNGSPPISPAGSSSPASPFSGKKQSRSFYLFALSEVTNMSFV
ncbi:dormancy-associated protein-like protein 3 isoform X1 [Cucumis melo var. makuwa]|uniref:Dormancy-associated protein-like protein 3 isoform X1 n=1 Tax=Cucumis melo var. makuwa TaxID=1194695 RepID=A0A5A7TWZ6_CUCMM|nr:dormancy-associated protein-like protein 3 isoform X1 [Cucumis melo var. makuwa]